MKRLILLIPGGPDALWDIGAHEYGASACY